MADVLGVWKPAHENLVVNDLVTALPWATAFVMRAEPSLHINVKEVQGILRTWCQRARRRPDARAVLLTDSRMGMGAVSKGRSATAMINKEVGLPPLTCWGITPTPGCSSSRPASIRRTLPRGLDP